MLYEVITIFTKKYLDMDHIKQRLIEVAKPKIEALHALNSTHANHVIQEVTLGSYNFV